MGQNSLCYFGFSLQILFLEQKKILFPTSVLQCSAAVLIPLSFLSFSLPCLHLLCKNNHFAGSCRFLVCCRKGKKERNDRKKEREIQQTSTMYNVGNPSLLCTVVQFYSSTGYTSTAVPTWYHHVQNSHLRSGKRAWEGEEREKEGEKEGECCPDMSEAARTVRVGFFCGI